MKKICVVTGSRAEYGLLKGIMNRIQADEELQLQLIATGAHLSEKLGATYREIEEDGFVIDRMIDMKLDSDNSYDITRSMGIGLIGFADALRELQPDMMLVLGDRYEILMAASGAMMNRIPTAHLCGGEVTLGAVDDMIRHAVTKMSYLHFTSAEEYRRRVIQLGEEPERVFFFGDTGVENILQLDYLTKSDLEASIRFPVDNRTLLITFHPVTNEGGSSNAQFRELLDALDQLEGIRVIFTKANADAGGDAINLLIDEYAARNPGNVTAFASLGQKRYLSAMKYCGAVIGNSSSGIVEAPALGIPSVNIGSRQTGRLKADSIIDCQPEKEDIRQAVQKALSDEFRRKINVAENPYQGINVAARVVDCMKETLADPGINQCKQFYDIPMTGKEGV